MQYTNTAKHSPVIRKMAIKKVFANLQRTLSLLQRVLAWNEHRASKVKTPHNIFSWSKEDLEARLKLENMAWLDLFIIDLPESYMAMRKLQVDIEELMEFTKLLYEKFHSYDTKIAKKLHSALKLLDFPEFMQIQLNWNANKEEELYKRLQTKDYRSKLLLQTSRKLNILERILSQNNVFDPIQTRYQIRYNESLVDQYEDSLSVEQNKTKKEIDRYNELMRIEKYCSECTVNALYAETNKYKTRIDHLGAQYEKEYEAVNNQLAFKRANFERMRVQRSFLEEEIVRFREEIVRFREENDKVPRVYPKEIKPKKAKKQQKNTESPFPSGKTKKK
ncbi:uncharacterized protein LOC105215322 [Zeugodacus cucurbitae]|uniref:uncharacterized protein LOC105215322 n=1 Tax=Zeugodacus cucurbitae TaxID=28588 RepID=UPI0023D9109C|nr:uncharacterized protein LOC105215322 [Zeugodacus cucurbitae]